MTLMQTKKDELELAEDIVWRARNEGRVMSAQERANVKVHVDNARLMADIQSTSDRASGRPRHAGALSNAMHSAGFDRFAHPSVTVDFPATFGATASFDGDYADAQRRSVSSPPLGMDTRRLFPILPFERIESSTTSVASFRQKSRTLPELSDMIRDIAATTDKPEVGTETELITEDLHQIAGVESGIANIMLESAAFSGWIDSDLRFAYESALDAHVVDEIAAASPALADAGQDSLEAVLNAAAAVADQGYSPSVLVASPTFLLGLVLLVQPGSGDYVFTGPNPLPLDGIRRVAVPSLDDVAYVIDPAAVGTLYNSAVHVQAFEENAGRTNTSTVRIESNGVFVVQRVGAIAEVTLGS